MARWLFLVALAISASGLEPLASGRTAKCGRGVILDLHIEDLPMRALAEGLPATVAVYRLVVQFRGTNYVAESNGGRIGLFGPLVANGTLELCVDSDTLILTRPRDSDPEVRTYKMKVIGAFKGLESLTGSEPEVLRIHP